MEDQEAEERGVIIKTITDAELTGAQETLEQLIKIGLITGFST